VNSISGYRTAFNWLSGLTPSDVGSSPARPIIAGAGIVAFLLFGYLAYRELPRPYFARHDLRLHGDEHGRIVVEPRALERIAETAAQQEPGVNSASGRYGEDDITVAITVTRARHVPAILRGVQERVTEALREHQLPTSAINVTLTRYDRRHRRELT